MINDLDFREIEFGDSDAQTEVSSYPELLLNGYFDEMGLVDQALNKRNFLFLGSKGSGKSALSERIKLLSQQDNCYSVNAILLNEFPYKLFTKIVKGNAENEAKYPIAWRFLLFLYAFSSFNIDSECTKWRADEWWNMSNILIEKGLLPIDSVSEIVRKTSKHNFSLNLGPLNYSFENEGTQDSGADINSVVYVMRELLKSVKTQKKHYLIVDGLDENMSSRQEQYQSIVSLIIQAKEINLWCKRNSVPFKVIVLCRTDLFDSLSDPNKNKLKQDFAHQILWFDESETDDDRSSALIKLANLRCKLKYDTVDDLFDTFFPKEYEGKPIRKALLDYTRHTPRDFLQLLKKIQQSCKSAFVTCEAITSGIKKYSIDYFKDEIKDEVAGYIPPNHIELVFELLSQFNQRDFKYTEIENKKNSNPAFKDVNWMEACVALFNCSAIGNRIGMQNLLYMKYRNPSKTFNHENVIMIHRGLWKALAN